MHEDDNVEFTILFRSGGGGGGGISRSVPASARSVASIRTGSKPRKENMQTTMQPWMVGTRRKRDAPRLAVRGSRRWTVHVVFRSSKTSRANPAWKTMGTRARTKLSDVPSPALNALVLRGSTLFGVLYQMYRPTRGDSWHLRVSGPRRCNQGSLGVSPKGA